MSDDMRIAIVPKSDQSKACKTCGLMFVRPADYSRYQWQARRYCSVACSPMGARIKRDGQRVSVDSPDVAPVEEFPGYGVSRDGRVWTKRMAGAAHDRTASEWREMRLVPFRSGHLYVGLTRDRKRVNKFVHTLVLLAFVGPRPKGMEACHFPDRDPANNRVENLRWDTRSANQLDRVQHGTDHRGQRHPLSKLSDDNVRRIRDLYETGQYTQAALGAMFGVHVMTIGPIIRRKRWQHI